MDFNINHITRKFSLNLQEFCPCCSTSKDTNHIHEKRKSNFIDDFGEGIVFQLFTSIYLDIFADMEECTEKFSEPDNDINDEISGKSYGFHEL